MSASAASWPKHLGTAPAIHLFDISHFRASDRIAVEQLQRQASLGPRRFLNSREITCNSRRTFSTSDPVNSASITRIARDHSMVSRLNQNLLKSAYYVRLVVRLT